MRHPVGGSPRRICAIVIGAKTLFYIIYIKTKKEKVLNIIIFKEIYIGGFISCLAK